MASYLPEGGKVAVIQHMLTTTTGIDRTRGVIDALTKAGNIEILGSFCCDNSTQRAQEITTALLEEDAGHPRLRVHERGLQRRRGERAGRARHGRKGLCRRLR